MLSQADVGSDGEASADVDVSALGGRSPTPWKKSSQLVVDKGY
ncbi:MAG: hypothetical protein AAGG53_00060 [Cyanobacteria bacterium P01_H01_bin.152]